MLTLTNDHLELTLNEDFSGTLRDLRNDHECSFQPNGIQESGPLAEEAVWNRQERNFMDRFACTYQLEKTGAETVRVRILDLVGKVRGSFNVRLALDAEWLVMEAFDLDEDLPSLIFPPFIASQSIVIPREIGVWHKRADCNWAAHYHMPVSGWNMRWVGGLQDDDQAGWIMVVDDGFEDSGAYRINLNASIGWQKTLGKWSPNRRVKIALTENSYVGLAKKFRSYAADHGLLQTLEEKMELTPDVRNLIGGRCLNLFQSYTVNSRNSRIAMAPASAEQDAMNGRVVVQLSHRDIKTIRKEAEEAGMKRGYLNIRGWINGGYDQSHPDVWPPEPALGSLDEFREIIGSKGSIIALLHENYQDIYAHCASFPHGVSQTGDGHYYQGGLWHGGQCYILNSRAGLDYARRNWEIFKRELDLRGIFLDTLAGAHFHQDFSPEHPQTRAQDAASKLEIGKFFKEQGLLIGSEEGSDFAVPVADFIENRHRRVQDETIPLWPLVYGDCVVNLRYASGTSDEKPASNLEDVLWGYAKLWPVPTLEKWRESLDDFKQSIEVDRWHEETATSEMVDHRFLDAERTLEQTTFRNGKRVIANFGEEIRETPAGLVNPGACITLDIGDDEG